MITAVIVTAVIVFSDRSPSSAPESAEFVEKTVTKEDVQIEKALEIINGGGPPMEGINMLKELAESEDPNINAVYQLAKYSVSTGQLDKAVERYSQMLELDPDNIFATWKLAMLNFEMGDLEQAVSRFQDCVEKDETLILGYFFMAQCYEAMGRKGEALKAAKTYLPLASDSVGIAAAKKIINSLEVEATRADDINP